MQTFSIRDIENLCGIKAHTLRVWEQRYGIIMPGRKESRHREYTNEDLKQILRISYLYHKGYKISLIAKMSPEEVYSRSLEYSRDTNFEGFLNQFIEATLNFDEFRFEEIFNTLVNKLGFEKTFTHVIYPYQKKIGLLWVMGNLFPSQEHFSSNLIRKKIILAIDGIPISSHPKNEKILLFAPEGEFHEIPLLLIHYFLKKSGYQVIYFGINTQVANLQFYSSVYSSFHIYFHLVTNFTEMDINVYLEKLIKIFPDKKILASGQVFQENRKLPAGVRILYSLNEIMELKVSND
jgi:DNA-binding transcriptional MerR regulator